MKNCLLKKHQEDGRYNYLLKQDNSHIGSYVLVYVPHENRNTVRFINIICLPSGTLQLSGSGNDTDTPQFPDITSLLRHYSSDGHLGVPLKMCVPPQSPGGAICNTLHHLLFGDRLCQFKMLGALSLSYCNFKCLVSIRYFLLVSIEPS